jgi:hypothetical protein
VTPISLPCADCRDERDRLRPTGVLALALSAVRVNTRDATRRETCSAADAQLAMNMAWS